MDLRALGRGLTKRCPVCGERDVFARYFTIRERCPRCDLEFEREEGYWLGAMVVAMTLVIVVFAVVFLGGLALTWPDVPWTTLLIVTIVVNGLLPIVAYPWCMTVWMGLHHAIVTTNRHETERPR
jgi:uncharacterized protein (DUF983 family)